MAEKTAMQKVIEHLRETYKLLPETEYELTNGLETEKQQIIEAHFDGAFNWASDLTPQQYFSQTYKQD